VVSADPLTRTVQRLHDLGDSLYLETVQDVTDIVELNKAKYSMFRHKAVQKWKGEWHEVASFPLSIYFDLLKHGLFDRGREAEMKAWVNDPENIHFRTRPGRI
jgi:hypothetical protein